MKLLCLVLAFFLCVTACSKKNEPTCLYQMPDIHCDQNSLNTLEWKEEIIDDALADIYYPVWKSRFLRHNNMTEHFFDEHITIFGLDTIYAEFYGTVSLAVSYEFKIGWVSTVAYETVMVQVTSVDSPMYAEGLPLNTNLSPQQIDDLKSTNPAIIPHFYATINGSQTLQYPDFLSAKKSLLSHLELDKLCGFSIRLNDRGNLSLVVDRYDREVYCRGMGRCVFSALDLVTGEIESQENTCILD